MWTLKSQRIWTFAATLMVMSAALWLANSAEAAQGGVPGKPIALPKGSSSGVEHRFLHALPAKPPVGTGGPSAPEVFEPSKLAAGANGETLEYHGGEVQHKPELYLLFWGENFWNHTQPYFPPAEGYEAVTLYSVYKGFFGDLSNEQNAPGEASWQGIMSQYYGAAAGGYGNGKVVGELDNTEANFFSGITKENILKMINYWVERGLKQGPNTQVIVFTAPGTTFNEDPENGCAYHGIDQQGYAYSFVPYAGDMDVYFKKHNQNLTCNVREAETKEAEIPQLMWSSTSIASHEYAETVTDPGPFNGSYSWFSAEGAEIGDLCDHWPVDSVELPEKNGRPGWWYVTELWDDEGGNTCKLEDPPYSEPAPPTVTTGGATGLQYYPTATVEGSVNPNGPETHYYFEYGPSLSYGGYAPSKEGVDIGTGTSTMKVSTTLTGLSASTTYHYRLVATSWAGTSWGTDHTFTTLPVVAAYSAAYGGIGNGNGQFKAPNSVALDASGSLLVTDSENNRFEKFTSNGSFVASYGSVGTGAGKLESPHGIAINPGTGNIFVSDWGNYRVDEFSSSGAFVRAFGWGVLNGKSEAEVCTTECQAGLSGSGAGQLNHPLGIAISPSGGVLVADGFNSRVVEFSATGTYVKTIGSYGSGEGQFSYVNDMAVDEGNIYVIDVFGQRIEEFNASGGYVRQWADGTEGNRLTIDPRTNNLYLTSKTASKVYAYTPVGSYVGSFGASGSGTGQFSNPIGIAINNVGTIYVVDNGNNRVERWVLE